MRAYHCSLCAGAGHNALTCPRRGPAFADPRCVDCGQTDSAQFYAHPTSRTGYQSRCKTCDNARRVKDSADRIARLPEAVRAARAAYLDVKVAHGVCRQLSCNNPVEEGKKSCSRCLRYHAASTQRWAERKENGAIHGWRDGT